jgi:copper(I)-binding protein
MRTLALLLLLASPFPAFSQQGFAKEAHTVEIEDAWSRATAPGSTLAAGYMTVRNMSDDRDRLLGGSSPRARKVETHVTLKDGNMMRMREVPGYDLPGRGRVELKPGGAHLMLLDIKPPFKEGEKIPLTLRFEKAGEVKVELEVRAAGTSGKTGGHTTH